jgi:hypothetical protein
MFVTTYVLKLSSVVVNYSVKEKNDYRGKQPKYTNIIYCGMSIGITQEQENVMKIEIKLSQSILGE